MVSTAREAETPDAVDWRALPGPPGWYRPEAAASGLRRLSAATNAVQVAEAASLLAGGGLVHGHSGAVFPAAVVAAPFLLSLLNDAHPSRNDAVLGLLDEAFECDPFPGYHRVPAVGRAGAPLCCGLAQHLRERRALLLRYGRPARSLLAEADRHWRFAYDDLIEDTADTVLIGSLGGVFRDGAQAAELRTDEAITELEAVRLELPPEDDDPTSGLRLLGVRRHTLPTSGVLGPATCGHRTH